MKGLFWASDSIFHSEPSLRDISLLCILGFSWAIFLLWILDQTIKAFIGLLMCSFLSFPGEELEDAPGGEFDEDEVGDI